MSAKFYDDALVDKILKWLPEEYQLRVLKPEETKRLFKINADLRNDKAMELPFIALSRKSTIRILRTGKQPLSYDGMKIRLYDREGNEIHKDSALKLNGIPMTLEYQLDIYTRNLDEAEEYVRNLTFKFINNPELTITIPYNDCKVMHNSTIYIDNDIEDTSDIPERLVPGEFSRYTMTLTIDNAYLFSVPVKDNLLISSISLETRSNSIDVDETIKIK